jgi:hypothetical protein
MHAYFAKRGNGVEIFAGDEHETDSGDEHVNLVDDDALSTTQKTANLRIVPTERSLYVMTLRAV